MRVAKQMHHLSITFVQHIGVQIHRIGLESNKDEEGEKVVSACRVRVALLEQLCGDGGSV